MNFSWGRQRRQKMSFIRSILFIDNPSALEISKYIITQCESLLPIVFMIALICEYFRKMDFKGVLLKLLFAVFAFKFFIPIHEGLTSYALDFSDKIVSEYKTSDTFVSSYQKNVADKKDSSIYSALFSITGKFNNLVGYLFNGLSYFCLFILKYVYSIVYYLTMVLFGLTAILSFIPIADRSLAGSFKASLWCAVMPIVVAFILILVGNSETVTFSDQIAFSDVTSGFLRYISLLCMSICLILAPIITTKLLDGTGVSAMAETIGKAATFSTINNTMGSYVIKGKSALEGAKLAKTTGINLKDKYLRPKTRKLDPLVFGPAGVKEGKKS